MSLANVPDEVIFNEIASRLSFDELRQLCQTDTRFAKICQNELVWRRVREREFMGSRRAPTLSEKQSFKFLRQYQPFETDPQEAQRQYSRYLRFNQTQSTDKKDLSWQLLTEDEEELYPAINPITQMPFKNLSSRLDRPLSSNY